MTDPIIFEWFALLSLTTYCGKETNESLCSVYLLFLYELFFMSDVFIYLSFQTLQIDRIDRLFIVFKLLKTWILKLQSIQIVCMIYLNLVLSTVIKILINIICVFEKQNSKMNPKHHQLRVLDQ